MIMRHLAFGENWRRDGRARGKSGWGNQTAAG